MRVQVAIPEHRIEQPVLDAALEAVTRLNESLLENREAPTFKEAAHRVRWKPEPPGQEHFDHAVAVLERGHGDCDDLAPWHAASLRVTGEDPGARATVYQSGPKRWHAIVERSDGRLEDPSQTAGMPTPRGSRAAVAGALGPAVVGSYMLRPQIALTPRHGQWAGRVDIPWHWEEEILYGEPSPTDWAMSTLHTAPTASAALTGVLCAGVELAERAQAADPEHLERLLALAAAAEGWEYPELAGEFGDKHARAAMAVVGAMYGDLRRAMGYDAHVGDFGDFLREAIPIAADVVPVAAMAIPGYGPAIAPVLKFGLEAAERELQSGKTPSKMPEHLKNDELRRQMADVQSRRVKAAKPQPREAVARDREGRWLCIPARWQ